MSEALKAVFQEAMGRNLKACVLRKVEELLDPGREVEVDVLLSPLECRDFITILKKHGFWCYSWRKPPGQHWLCVRYVREEKRWITIDIISSICFDEFYRLPVEKEVLKHARKHPHFPVHVPLPEHELALLILHCVLDKKVISPVYVQNIKFKLFSDSIDKERLSNIFSSWLSLDLSKELMECLCSLDLQGLLKLDRSMRYALASYQGGRPRLVLMICSVRRFLNLLKRYLSFPGGLEVAILGADGAGKTSTIDAFQQIWPYPSRRVYMGKLTRVPVALKSIWSREFSGNDATRTDDSRSAIPLALRGGWRGFVLRLWVWFAGLYRVLVAKVWARRGYLILYDRYTYDYFLESFKTNEKVGGKKLIRWFPKPDLIVHLSCSPSEMIRRKNEGSYSELASRDEAYGQLFPFGIPKISIDTTEALPIEVAYELEGELWFKYVQSRFSHSL